MMTVSFMPINKLKTSDSYYSTTNELPELQATGVGSGTAVGAQQTIAGIAKHSWMSAKWGQLLFRMVDYYQPVHILELGTSLGITGSYLSMANTNASLTTLEETVAIAAIAKANFKKLGIRNSRLIEGDIEQTLSEWLAHERDIDLALINSKHLHKPATHYFRQLLNHTHENSILIFTDIHRSKTTEQAWRGNTVGNCCYPCRRLVFYRHCFFPERISCKTNDQYSFLISTLRTSPFSVLSGRK